MQVFVLIDGEVQRPIGVTQHQELAERFYSAETTNDYIPFELDDLALAGMPEVRPTPPAERVDESQQVTRQLNDLTDRAQRTLQQGKPRSRQFRSSLLG